MGDTLERGEEALRAWIGRERLSVGVVGAEIVARLRATLQGFEMPEADVPLGIHWCVGVESAPQRDLAKDGHPTAGGFLPPVPLPRRMWAAGELTFHGALCVGDALHRRSIVGDVRFKKGRSGTLCFVTLLHELWTARGLVAEEKQEIVYRDPAPKADDGPGASAKRRTTDAGFVADPALLFRYSALTFNAHRIHYDHAYAVEEGYRERVVHGPLQATLLMNLAASRGGAPSRFSFRALRPAFANSPLETTATRVEGGMRLAVVDGEGLHCMEADAAW